MKLEKPPLFDVWNTYIGFPKTELPLAKVQEIKMSGWSSDSNGNITIYPEGNFDNTEMIKVTI